MDDLEKADANGILGANISLLEDSEPSSELKQTIEVLNEYGASIQTELQKKEAASLQDVQHMIMM